MTTHFAEAEQRARLRYYARHDPATYDVWEGEKAPGSFRKAMREARTSYAPRAGAKTTLGRLARAKAAGKRSPPDDSGDPDLPQLDRRAPKRIAPKKLRNEPARLLRGPWRSS